MDNATLSVVGGAQGLPDAAATAADGAVRAAISSNATLGDAATAMPQAVSHAANAANATLGAADGLAAASVPAFSWGGYIQAVGVLFLLVGLLWLVLWAVRRHGGLFRAVSGAGGFSRDDLRLEAQLPLGPRKGLMVVRFLNRRLLLGVTDQQITLLTEQYPDHEHGSEDDIPSFGPDELHPPAKGGFSAMLGRALGKGRGQPGAGPHTGPDSGSGSGTGSGSGS